MIEHSKKELQIARQMAEDVNGGSWDKNYTPAQKSGWILKARWMLNNSERYNNDT